MGHAEEESDSRGTETHDQAEALTLADRGHRVTVIDSAAEAGRGTSFANGAQLSYAYTDALASPTTLAQMPRLLLAPYSFAFDSSLAGLSGRLGPGGGIPPGQTTDEDEDTGQESGDTTTTEDSGGTPAPAAPPGAPSAGRVRRRPQRRAPRAEARQLLRSPR